jgi:ATP-dependent helicase YprA (DUF1998 family)
VNWWTVLGRSDNVIGIFSGFVAVVTLIRVNSIARARREERQLLARSLRLHELGHSLNHQTRAFERLSTLRGQARPTLITTGTGSGKTESFLVPVLDHCRRQRALGRHGVKAVLLYPMNALATDQAARLNDHLVQPGLHEVTGGLYIGDVPQIGYPKVMTQRSEIRRNPPDVLITNYKMLDLLLQRADDLPLWQDAELAYVVVNPWSRALTVWTTQSV